MTTELVVPLGLIEAISAAVLKRDGKRRGKEIEFRCFYPERHDKGDAHPSCNWNADKGVWLCRVCQAGGGAFEIAELLDIDRHDFEPELIWSNGTHDTKPELTLAGFAERRHLPLGMLVEEFEVSEAHVGGRPALRFPTKKGDRYRFLDGEKPKAKWVTTGGETLYNSARAADLLRAGAETLYLVNGEPSVWACHTAGVPAICLCVGEQAPSPEGVAALRGYLEGIGHAVRIAVAFDRDTAGRAAQTAAIRTLSAGGLLVAGVVLPDDLPEGGDVDDLHRRVGPRLGTVLADCTVAEEPDDAAGERERQAWRQVIETVPVFSGDPPYWMQRWMEHVRPFARAFDQDWELILALPFWASFWPHVRMENLNLAVWSLGFGKQNVGKNLVSDELRAVAREVGRRTLEFQPLLYTSGTVEGMWDKLAGSGKQMICYQAEFGGYLQTLTRDHMIGARQALCDLYDGREVGYARSQGKGVEVIDPYVVVCATINVADWVQYARLSDLSNGYLSRFIMWAGDPKALSPDYYPSDDDKRKSLINQLVEHVRSYQNVTHVAWADGQPPDAYRQYAKSLGSDSGEVLSLDDHRPRFEPPTGRLLARVKKIAALLALAESTPDTVVEHEGRTVLVAPQHAESAVAIVRHGAAYAERVARFIGETDEMRLNKTVLSILRDQPEGVTQRELCRRTGALAADMGRVLKLNQEAGALAPMKHGRKTVWAAIGG